ncbi:NADPH-dependent butanol dehydrogenase Adh (plasmid) [Peptoclostridium acidaminophilum DSM 3953]|uniref:NADPH-dependent butanol dehydrogenase Adh n=1 Tax=Peptoclostridium acidaminophilum DSM 3953 TaxID=1286171 RepID=W8UBQ7_PEPAC|nr:iron-containing alcohol dehydrogenase family protein [Peptoclostridium acidaminophilum]AHM58151.1 NADPH-dependent butanol dehydrogenase Adh [Peptoclostridium acidaminophilum DSM 3953]
MDFTYHMPTKIVFGKGAVRNAAAIFKETGRKAIIVTGRQSSKKNGSLSDVVSALGEAGVGHILFDEVDENPGVKTVQKAAEMAREAGADFVIGIGGGSPMDFAKGVAVLLENIECTYMDLIEGSPLGATPVIAVATTSGTGSEVTHYAIFTDYEENTKKNYVHRIFPRYALCDPSYTQFLSAEVTVNTAVDALSHLVEGYMANAANPISDMLARSGFEIFKKCKQALLKGEFGYEDRENLMLCSTVAGMVISQAGTSLPHGMGYPLTYFKGIAHGRANGLVMREYLEFCSDTSKLKGMLKLLEMSSLSELGEFLDKLLGLEKSVSADEIAKYSSDMIRNVAKLKNHPCPVKEEDILGIYTKSLLR